MNIEVAYAKPDEQLIVLVQVSDRCKVKQAIELSGILAEYPEIDLTKNKVGVFSQICTLGMCLQENDRVEIYRCLTIDPMEARRQRAIKQERV